MASSITDQLRDQFKDKSNNAHRLHRVMAYHEHDGDKAKLSQCLEIISRLGIPLSGEAKAQKWTPLQVAIVTGYGLGVECLLEKGVIPTPRAIEYARVHHPEFLPLLESRDAGESKVEESKSKGKASEPRATAAIRPHEVGPRKVEVFHSTFPHEIEMPKDPFIYQSQNDFGVRIKQLVLSRDITPSELEEISQLGEAMDIRTTYLTPNMQQLADLLGFRLELTQNFYFLRDHIIPQVEIRYIGGASGLAGSDGGTAREHIQEAIERGASWMVHMKMGASSYTNHMSFSGITGSTLKNADRAASDYLRMFEKDRPEGRLHLDGGNIFTVTVQGRRKVLLGISHLGINHHLCHRAGFVQENERMIQSSGGSVTYPSGLSPKKIREYAEEKYALGRVKIGGRLGVLSRHNLGVLHYQHVRGEVKCVYDLAVQKGMITPIPAGLAVKESTVQRFAYERGVAKELTAMTLGVPQSDVHYIPEMGYHLDTFMRPGPKGTMLLQDYRLTAQFLAAMSREPEAFELTDTDQEILERYIHTAEMLSADLKPLADGVVHALEQAGIQVIPIPALFFDESRELKGEPTYHVNFINGVSGYSAKTKRFYYITTGAQVGDRLGEALMDLFSWYIKKTEPRLDVFFVGRNPEDPSDFSEAMRYWNRPGDLASQSGLHCMTMETDFGPVRRK